MFDVETDRILPDRYQALLEPFAKAFDAGWEAATLHMSRESSPGPDTRIFMERAFEDSAAAAVDAAVLAGLEADAANAVPALIEALGEKHSLVRWCADFALSRLGPVAVLALAAAVREGVGDVARMAAQILGDLGAAAQDAVPALVAALGADSWYVRNAAAEALARMGPAAKGAVPALVAALRDVKFGNRGPAVHALGKIGSDAVSHLVAALRETDGGIRATAAEALGLIGPTARAAVPDLIEALGQMGYDVRSKVVAALERIGPDAVPHLIVALRQDDAGIRAAAAEALGLIGPAAKEAVLPISEVLHDGDGNVRGWAMITLGRIGPAAVPALVKALREGVGDVRWMAARSLGEVGPSARDAVPALVEALQDGDPTVRWRAARALGKVGLAAPEAAVPALTKALDDQDDEVRKNARTALERIEAGGRTAPRRPEGIERMGNEAVLNEDALETFRQVGKNCKTEDTNTFKLTKLQMVLGMKDSTIQHRLFTQVNGFFRRYFRQFEDIAVADGNDPQAPKEQKLFERRRGKPPMICHPLGWRAWELTCRCLEQRDRM
jgi:HEAT repeat protein